MLVFKSTLNKEQKKASQHSNRLGEGAKKRKALKGKDKVGVVMHEFKRGTLHSGSGDIVKDRNQAVAIAMSESGLSKKNKVKKSSSPRLVFLMKSQNLPVGTISTLSNGQKIKKVAEGKWEHVSEGGGNKKVEGLTLKDGFYYDGQVKITNDYEKAKTYAEKKQTKGDPNKKPKIEVGSTVHVKANAKSSKNVTEHKEARGIVATIKEIKDGIVKLVDDSGKMFTVNQQALEFAKSDSSLHLIFPSKKLFFKSFIHKYIKRTGTKGNYKYWYKNSQGKLVQGKKPVNKYGHDLSNKTYQAKQKKKEEFKKTFKKQLNKNKNVSVKKEIKKEPVKKIISTKKLKRAKIPVKNYPIGYIIKLKGGKRYKKLGKNQWIPVKTPELGFSIKNISEENLNTIRKDTITRNQFISENQSYISDVIKKHRMSFLDKETHQLDYPQAYQLGNIGFIRAIEKFNTKKYPMKTFSTYLHNYIFGYIKHGESDVPGIDQENKINSRVETTLDDQLSGVEEGDKEIKRVDTIAKEYKTEGQQKQEILDKKEEKKQKKQNVKNFIETIKKELKAPKEKKVADLLIKVKKAREIAEQLKLTPARVSQIIKKIKNIGIKHRGMIKSLDGINAFLNKLDSLIKFGEYKEEKMLVLKAFNHKYIKRTGVKGNYKYWYKDSSGKLVEGGKPKEKKNLFDIKMEAAKMWSSTEHTPKEIIGTITKKYGGKAGEIVNQMIQKQEEAGKRAHEENLKLHKDRLLPKRKNKSKFFQIMEEQHKHRYDYDQYGNKLKDKDLYKQENEKDKIINKLTSNNKLLKNILSNLEDGIRDKNWDYKTFKNKFINAINENKIELKGYLNTENTYANSDFHLDKFLKRQYKQYHDFHHENIQSVKYSNLGKSISFRKKKNKRLIFKSNLSNKLKKVGLSKGKNKKFNPLELKIGACIETEHTGKDKLAAKEIAKDHLTEDKNYYKNKLFKKERRIALKKIK